MKAVVRCLGARREPVGSVAAAAEVLWGFLRASRELLPTGTRWLVITGAGRRVALLGRGPLEKVLASSGPKRASEVVPGVPPYQVTVLATAAGGDVLHLAAGFTTSEDGRAPGVRIEIGVAERALAGGDDAEGAAKRLFGRMVQAFELDAARGVPGGVAGAPELPMRARVGWLTFVPERLGPLPPLPPRAASERLDRRGWVVCAHPGLPVAKRVEYTESLAHLRHALGARVVLDGPSFPAPAVETPAGLPAPPEAAPARAPEVASFMKAPAPLGAETAAVDVSKILKQAVPFGKDAASVREGEPSGAGAPVEKAAAVEKAPSATPGFGETEEFSLAALLQRPRPVPFEGAPGRGAAAGGASGPGPQRRLVRFDPQTGQALAQPYWEELPPPERKP